MTNSNEKAQGAFANNGESVTSKYTRTYTSFSGADTVAILDINIPNKEGGTTKVSRVIGEITTLSYSIHMDKSPVRSIGSVNAKGYVFGPRTIAGSLVFSQFNRHIAHDILLEANKSAESGSGQMVVMDEMPPFNLTISMANEYGQKARFALYNIQIINEGNVISINDVYTENTYQFVATDIEYLTDNDGSGSSGVSQARTYYDEKVVALVDTSGAKALPSLPNADYREEDLYISTDEDGSSLVDKNDEDDTIDRGHNVGPEDPNYVLEDFWK